MSKKATRKRFKEQVAPAGIAAIAPQRQLLGGAGFDFQDPALTIGEPGYVNFDQVGKPGLKQFSGYIYDEPLAELQGPRGRAEYREMADNDPVVGGFMFAVEMLIRRVDWRVDPGDDSPEAKADADFVDSVFHDMENTWEDTLSEILTFLPHGFEVSEVLYKRRLGPDVADPLGHSRYSDGLIGWRALEGRAQETVQHWVFDDNGKAVGFIQMAPPFYRLQPVSLNKCLHFRTTGRKGNPEGRSVLRNSWLPWRYKRGLERVEAIGVERDLAGLPVALVPPQLLSAQATASDRQMLNTLMKILTNIRRDEQEGIAWPKMIDPKTGQDMYELKLLNSGGMRQHDTDKIIGRYNQNIAMPMLADFILLGHEAVGSKALSTDKTDMFTDAISAWLDSIADVFNTKAIPDLMFLNNRSLDVTPKLVHGDIQSVDLDKLGNFILHLAQGGMPLFPNEELQSWLLTQANMPGASVEQQV